MTEKTFIPTPEQSPAFREALGCFGTGVTVITTQTEGGPRAITVNSFASVSLDPPLVLWCLAKESFRFDAFSSCEHYSIHVMAQDQQEQALLFARDGTDFSHADWTEDETGRPQLTQCLARFDCRLHARHDAGDHLIIVGQVEQVMYRTGKGLIFKRGQFGGFVDLI
ncbi:MULTISPECIES: flavin reductase family protein [unclassified Ruegeria]|uniref:flavin reductase family protein n=1 Tax=unclassified Ruegeria TaxID=2625375 RepID=UPI001487D265|nr:MULTISPECIES: flavin reductase family protein [unclassified Ruegeria]NOD45978.1 flavin reductase [Ruegeria sp. HKCCD5849]NOD50722.1 flavin reductase [Ruegeria sp. HKCCD5851]NOD67538.1 flavin reductase [Ruegeria sp. HKCCD7303]NOE33124.1 flavin reductase [Ruegeria sp. HKCCD7318]